MRQLLCLFVVLGLLTTTAYSEQSTTELFPDLQPLNTERASNSYIGNGKWTLVKLWSDHCPICEAQAPMMSELHEKYKDDNLEVVGVAIDGLDKVDQLKAFVEKKQYPFPSYIGDLGVIGVNYEVLTQESFLGTPTYVLFNPEGEMLAINPGPLSEGAIERFIASH